MSLACTKFHVSEARYTWAKQGDPSRRDAKNTENTSISINRTSLQSATPSFWTERRAIWIVLWKEATGIRLNNQNFNRDGGLMLSHAWHPVINMLSNQETGLTQQTLDTNRQLPLASALTWAWYLGRPIPGADCFSRHINDLKTRKEMVLKMVAFSSLNHLTRLVAWKDFIIQCRRESYKSYNICIVQRVLFSNISECKIQVGKDNSSHHLFS
jgi:hypothetical protein